jgi:hypothetical protein
MVLSKRFVMIKGIDNVSDLKKKFEQGKAANAQGARLNLDTRSDNGLALNNLRREKFQFLGFAEKIENEKSNYEQEQASLRLARQLQDEEVARSLAEQDDYDDIQPVRPYSP